ncbi:WD40 repeat domain-containing protein [Streptomyces sp. S07_1.15]|uniref:WD40 repeat domain-containing protein n=1 Tax=Streptomyces sp. S07_1.15 TaxID=2873925 RepID=UPI001D15DCE2|nr:WD40 repeat domain-containing protein [Streptomyces sp. S07_1.15]MCC3654795.1 WD40 repeat domain-containing protein [Streptomyces sp. S07_1.15]
MNIEQLVRESLREGAEEGQPPPADFADRVLRVRRRRRSRRIVTASVAAVVAIAVAMGVPVLNTDETRPAEVTVREDVSARPGQSPPRDLVAAGETALSAYYRYEKEKLPNGDEILHRRWHLYNADTERYEKADWAYLDVAPGMETAAVLEKLPAQRVGLLDLRTGKVRRWLETGHGMAGLEWSPDGRRIVATTYDRNPGHYDHTKPVNVNGKEEPGPMRSRTGFAVIDAASGESTWHELPAYEDARGYLGNAREDMSWNRDGTLLYTDIPAEPYRQFYDLRGRRVAAPRDEMRSFSKAGLSPDGRLAAGDFAGRGEEIATEVLDASTGKRVALQPVQELLAWADSDRLIAWGCDPDRCSGKGEFRQQLVLVDVAGRHVAELTGFRRSGTSKSWVPVFTRR